MERTKNFSQCEVARKISMWEKNIVQIILLREIQKSHEKGRQGHCAKDKEGELGTREGC